jgi:hypothetical protein
MQGHTVCLDIVIEMKVLVFAGIWTKIVQILNSPFTDLYYDIKMRSEIRVLCVRIHGYDKWGIGLGFL